MFAPFRIQRPLSKAQRAALPSTRSPDSYAERLLKLVPAEAIALYLAGRGVITGSPDPVAGLDPQSALLGWGILGLVIVVALRWWGTADRKLGESPQIGAVIVSAISYLVWIYSLGDSFKDYGVHDPKLGGLLVIVWTFVVPFIYRGSRDDVSVI